MTGADHRDDDGAPRGGPTSAARHALALLLSFASLVLIVLAALAVLLLASAAVVFGAGWLSGWLGLSELHIVLATLGILTMLVVAVIGTRIASELSTTHRELRAAAEQTNELLADLTCAIEELPSAVRERPVLVQHEARSQGPSILRPRGRSRGRSGD